MPNWCFNRLEVRGTLEELATFKWFVESEKSVFCFEGILPVPAELDAAVDTKVLSDGSTVQVCRPPGRAGEGDLIAQFGTANSQDWVRRHWGTNKVAFSVELKQYQDLLEYTFDTAWGPPKGIYLALIKRFPGIEISWFFDEPSMEYAGYLSPDANEGPGSETQYA